MKVLYFAWLKAATGRSEEEVNPPAEVTSVAALITWLKEQGPGHSKAFADLEAVRVAVNQEFSDHNQAIGPDDEIAFFPPITGG